MKRTTTWAVLLLATVLRCGADELEQQFASPPDAARPWVYWYFMDGNLTREGLTADLEAMKAAGIGGAIFLEVNIGIPRGPVEFMSGPWRALFVHAVHEAERLGIQIALGTGPGWCGTGGPWVKPEQSMQHLVASTTNVVGPARFDAILPRPAPRTPYFGERTLTPELHKLWADFYRDECVLAFPTPAGTARLADADEKALYFREPYSSKRGVRPFLPMPAEFPILPAGQCIATNGLLDLTAQRDNDGRLTWDVPPGEWTILRFGRTTTGQTTRPAPQPGLGLESDKFSRAALDAHYAKFVGALLKEIGPRKKPDAGLTMIHFDSWEMSSQNWSENFRADFRQRRGYDPLPFLPALLGRVVQSPEMSERFLWDLRQVAQELVITNHAVRLKELGRQSHLPLSIEPYDLNPASDLELGGVADVPMCEFWSQGHGFATEYSCLEAASIAHTLGRSIVAAEAFTAAPGEDWLLFPGALKAQGDWALCCGINRFAFHRYQHQPWLDRWPGMTMGPYGVHWERTQTWWDMVPAYHTYLTRCQALLRRGEPIADILYLAGEGAPHVFRPPASALLPGLPDRRGYNFDGCAPSTLLMKATVKDGRLVLPGASYRVLVLPRFATMTPALLGKIKQLVAAGATVVGAPPQKSPSLQNFPGCDAEVQRLAAEIWSAANRERVIHDTLPQPAAPAATSSLPAARWIWFNEPQPAPVGQRSFRREIVLPATQLESAMAQMTADNSFALFINGSPAGTGHNFHDVVELDVAALLKPGTNVVTVTVENGGDAPNPAGLLGVLAVKFSDGTSLVVPTDASWTSSHDSCGPWTATRDLGPMNMAPWKVSSPSPTAKPVDVYPDYAGTAALLARLGVAPDFESTGDVRYIHRREVATEIYFIGNRTAQPLAAECRFRVAGKQPELWDPLTGERRTLPNFGERDGRTSVPLEFAPHQSFFVIFRQPAAPGTGLTKNFPTLKPAQELVGPWQVQFVSKVGKPFSQTFQALENWTQRTEPDIKFFSGTATYRKTFELVPDDRGQKSAVRDQKAKIGRASKADLRLLTSDLWLELGTVHVMARIKLNGQDLGVVWCAPWRVEIPAGLLRASGNELEITVANLWINRLIGDAALPPEQRQTWTTRNPFKKDSPLQPSGLLGPVRLLAAQP